MEAENMRRQGRMGTIVVLAGCGKSILAQQGLVGPHVWHKSKRRTLLRDAQTGRPARRQRVKA